MEECVGGGARPPPKDEEEGAPRRGTGRLRSRLGVGSSVGIRRGDEEEDDGVVPASWGMPLGRGFLGMGGGGIIIEDDDGAGAGAGVVVVVVKEGGAGRSAICCCSGVIFARLGLISRLGLVERPATLGGEGILEGGVGFLDGCRSSETLEGVEKVGVDVLGRTKLGVVGCRISGNLKGVVEVGDVDRLGKAELGIAGSASDDGWDDSERTRLGTLSAGVVAAALGVGCSSWSSRSSEVVTWLEGSCIIGIDGMGLASEAGQGSEGVVTWIEGSCIMGANIMGVASWAGSSSTGSSSFTSCSLVSGLVSSEAVTWIEGSSSSCVMSTGVLDLASSTGSSSTIPPSLSFSSLVNTLVSSASLSSGPVTGGLLGGGAICCWRKLAKSLGSHCGGRKQKSTTDATSRESPITPIATTTTGLWVMVETC